MKKFIIGFMCVILLSCHPVAASFASIPKGQLAAQITNTDDGLSLCKDIAAFAYISMTAHQNGVSEEDQLALAPAPTTQEEAILKVLLDGIVHDATIFPVYKDVSDKGEVSERFSKVIYDICNRSK